MFSRDFQLKFFNNSEQVRLSVTRSSSQEKKSKDLKSSAERRCLGGFHVCARNRTRRCFRLNRKVCSPLGVARIFPGSPCDTRETMGAAMSFKKWMFSAAAGSDLCFVKFPSSGSTKHSRRLHYHTHYALSTYRETCREDFPSVHLFFSFFFGVGVFSVRIGFVGSFSAPTLYYLVLFFCLTRVKQEKCRTKKMEIILWQ